MVLVGSIDDAWQKWRATVLEGIRSFIPTKKVKLQPNSSPWFGLACAKARLRKIAAWKLWRRYPSAAAHRSYRQACAHAWRTYIEARRSYFHSVATSVADNPSSPKCFCRRSSPPWVAFVALPFPRFCTRDKRQQQQVALRRRSSTALLPPKLLLTSVAEGLRYWQSSVTQSWKLSVLRALRCYFSSKL